MVTSAERMAMAERLREMAREHGAVQCNVVAHALGLVYEVHGCIAAFGGRDVAALADLIDPTCEAVHSATSADDELVCSECGATLGAEIDGRQAFVSNFCPCCGARVMRDSA